MKKSNKKIKTEEFDKQFDEGKDMWDFLDMKRVKAHKNIRRVNIDFPEAMLEQIEEEAHKIGVARSALIKLWLSERLEHA
ncbi:MAG: CopG family antitoxin [Candidatus Omnitrophota bacterium]